MSSPMFVGDIMRQLFILREDGTVDLDMLASHLRAEELHPDPRRLNPFSELRSRGVYGTTS